ncbi:unnamed protein product [Rotaria magnacalcarata]
MSSQRNDKNSGYVHTSWLKSDDTILKQSITTLDLASNEIGDTGATYLARALKNNTTLTSLDILANRIGDQQASNLTDLLKKKEVRSCDVLADSPKCYPFSQSYDINMK